MASQPTINTQPVFLAGQEVRNISGAGLTVYWVTFGLMAASAVIFFVLTLSKPLADRSHGYVTTLIVTVAAIAYYAMAAQGGSTAIGLSGSTTVYRNIYFARYIDWFVTTPLLLLDLFLISAAPIGEFLWIVGADILMILTGLFGATSSHRYKWGFFGAGCLFQLLLTAGMLWKGIGPARRRSPKIGILYMGLTGYLLVLWFGYPIVWGLAEGSNHITINAEAASYAGLDICAKVIFGFIVMLSYPILSRTNKEEYATGKFLPSLLPAPINAVLSPAYTPVPNSPGYHQHTNPVAEPYAADGVGNGTRASPAATTGTKASPVATPNTAGPPASAP